MENIVNVADYIVRKYEDITKESGIDRFLLCSLLYFTQRESLAIINRPAFTGEMHSCEDGVISEEVEKRFNSGTIMGDIEQISDELKYIVNNVILSYGSLASWRLRELIQKEKSWIRSRNSTEGNNEVQVLSIEDIRQDARKVRPYDHVWDMFYDEFEDLNSNEERKFNGEALVEDFMDEYINS